MSHLFFIDESGQDGRQMPYEVHGGIVVPMQRAWELINMLDGAQTRLFGKTLRSYEVELKGETLLQKRIFKFAGQHGRQMADAERTTLAASFLDKGYQEKIAKREGRTLRLPRTADEFRAFGMACLEMVDEVFQSSILCEAKGLAAVVDQNAPRPPTNEWDEMLRKDFVFLFERLYYFMETRPRGCMATIVFDAKDDLASPRCIQGEQLNRLIARYFTKSHTGRVRSMRIFPEPLYCRSDLTTLLGVADLLIYAINHVFRPHDEWSSPIRQEMRPYVDWIYKMRCKLQREDESNLWTIFHVDDLRPRGA